MQTLIIFFEEIRKNKDKYAGKIEKILTSIETIDQEKFADFIVSFQISLTDGQIGQIIRFFDLQDTKSMFTY